MCCPLENEWLRDYDHKDETEEEGDHEMNLDGDPVASEWSVCIITKKD